MNADCTLKTRKHEVGVFQEEARPVRTHIPCLRGGLEEFNACDDIPPLWEKRGRPLRLRANEKQAKPHTKTGTGALNLDPFYDDPPTKKKTGAGEKDNSKKKNPSLTELASTWR